MAGDLRTNRNELIKVVSDFWSGAAGGIIGLGDVAKIVIADVDNDGNPDGEINPAAGGNKKPFARMRIQHTEARPRSISARRYRTNGAITVNLFVPRIRSDAQAKSILIGEALTSVLRKHRGSVCLTGVTPRERPINNGFNQIDVVSDFYWEQFVQPGAN
jgi:hypothetical protein